MACDPAQERRLILINKPTNVRAVLPEQLGNLNDCAVAKADPDDLRRGASQDAEMIKEVVSWMEKYWGPPTSR